VSASGVTGSRARF